MAAEVGRRRSLRISTAGAAVQASTNRQPEPKVTPSSRRRQSTAVQSSKRAPKRTRQSHSSSAANAAEEQHAEPEPSELPKKKRKKAEVVYTLDDFLPRPISDWKIGPHVSAAGGIENTVINAAALGATAFALFLKSQRKWTAPPFKPESISLFKDRLREFGYSPDHILPHGSYLVNLGNPDEEKRQKSYECFLDELQRCEELGLKLYNFHPGSTVGKAEIEESLTYIAECINKAHEATSSVIIVIENMAGAGNVVGGAFSEIGGIINQVEDKSRIGVCLDTCHTFAAGYDIRTKEGWNAMLDEFDHEVGLKYLRAMHMNDSKADLGSKKDRHENIGLGYLSLSTFAHIVVDPRTKNIPLILETPAFDNPGPNVSDGMDVWKKEVDILNRLSNCQDAEDDADAEKLDEWTEEIQEVVNEASAKKNARGGKVGSKAVGKKKTSQGGSKKGKKNVVEEEESSSSLSDVD
ncbi:unnamed protein product [Somion occarium]